MGERTAELEEEKKKATNLLYSQASCMHLSIVMALLHCIRELVESLCRDDEDMPMPPCIRKACNRPNAAFVSLFRYLTVIYRCFST